MANYYSWMVTAKTFAVKDFEAFKKEMEALGAREDNWDGGLTFTREEDGKVWIGGYDASLARWDPDTDEEVVFIPIIQRHMTPDSVAVIQEVGQEKLRYVVGVVHVITSIAYESKDLDQIGEEIANRLLKDFIETLPRQVQLLGGHDT